MTALRIIQSREIAQKLNDFKAVRAERFDEIKSNCSSEAQLKDDLMIDPIITQINHYIEKIESMSIPESIELVNN